MTMMVSTWMLKYRTFVLLYEPGGTMTLVSVCVRACMCVFVSE